MRWRCWRRWVSAVSSTGSRDGKAVGCPPLDGCPTNAERKAEYERISGRELHHWDYFYTLAAFKVHMSMMLVFRAVPPEMESIKRASLDFTWQCVLDSQAKCGNLGGKANHGIH